MSAARNTARKGAQHAARKGATNAAQKAAQGSNRARPTPVAAPPAAEVDTPPADGGEWIAIGRILGMFGSSGEVRVQSLSRFPQRFRELHRVYVGEARRPAAVLHRRHYGPGLILRLDLAQSRAEAQALFGQYLYVPEAEAVALPEGEYFVHQITGLAVVTTEGEALGTVQDVLQTGSNDVYVVQGPRGEVLLPATAEVIKEVDLAGGTLRVLLLPGLLD